VNSGASLVGLLLLVVALIYGLGSIRSKELARSAVHAHCRKQGLVLLDDTVVLKRLALCRNGLGRVVLRRQYRFEFSSDGDLRYSGEVILSGRQVQAITTDAYRWSPTS